MTLFFACVFALLTAVFGFATYMYYGTVEYLLDELETLDRENDHLVGVVLAQQEAIQAAHEASFIS